MHLPISELNFINKLIDETTAGQHEWINEPFAGNDTYVIKTDDLKVIFSIRETEVTKTKVASGAANINGEMIRFKIEDWEEEFSLAIKLMDAILESINKNDKVNNLLTEGGHPFVGSYMQPTKPNPSF